MQNRRIHKNTILMETNGSVCGQLWFLSYMQLVTKLRSGFCARFLYRLVSVAVGLCWCKSSWVFQSHVSRRCCPIHSLTSIAPHCRGTTGPLSPPPGAPVPFILARCVAFVTRTGKDLGGRLTAWRLAGLQSQRALKLGTWGRVSRALAGSFKWWR